MWCIWTFLKAAEQKEYLKSTYHKIGIIVRQYTKSHLFLYGAWGIICMREIN